MNVILATGNPELDQLLDRKLHVINKAQFLEEILDMKEDIQKVDVIIISSYLASIFNGDHTKVNDSFKSVSDFILKQGCRIVYLTDIDSSIETLEYLYRRQVYDYAISKTGILNLKEIINLVYHPATQPAALIQLEEFKSIQQQEPFEVKVSKQVKPIDEELISYDSSVQNGNTKENRVIRKPLQNKVSSPSHLIQPEMKDLSTNRLSDVSRTRVVDQQQAVITNGKEKTFAFWGQTQNSGKRTLSQAFAHELAGKNYKTLYVELDYEAPSFASTTGLSSRTKNFYQLCLSQDNFILKNFIATKTDAEIRGKGFQKLVSLVSPNLHFLSLPMDFKAEMFPSITGEFIDLFMSSLKELEYDAIVLNLPGQLKHILNFPVMLEVDAIFHVLTDNIVRINEYRELKEYLKATPLDLEKWHTVFNMVGEGVTKEALDLLIGEKSLAAVPMDPKRSLFEKDLQFGSSMINKHMWEVAKEYGFEGAEEIGKKKRFRFPIFS